jgi:hypothetical protein
LSWSEEVQYQIDKTLAEQSPKDVLATTITRLIEAKITNAFYCCGIGGLPSCDPTQEVDFYERLLAATIERFEASND